VQVQVKFLYVLKSSGYNYVLVLRKRWAGNVARIGGRRDA